MLVAGEPDELCAAIIEGERAGRWLQADQLIRELDLRAVVVAELEAITARIGQQAVLKLIGSVSAELGLN